MEKPLEIAWEGTQVGWGGVSGSHQSRVNSVSQTDGDSDMVSAAGLVRAGASQKRNNDLCQHFCL